ncbi:hypothetical protein [Streptomyces sp. HUAS TT7]|uniref:hypothetical protein n=1 Tax=Streptomyces sp. HUAS TT7 TaxID=3447507 RepID=UPI003F65B46E
MVILRAIRRRRERLAAEQRARHFQAQVQQATDMAITAAVRARLSEPVTDIHITWPLRVTVGDVLTAAREHFALDVHEADAAAMLRHRLEWRGHAGWGDLVTDAYEYDD